VSYFDAFNARVGVRDSESSTMAIQGLEISLGNDLPTIIVHVLRHIHLTPTVLGTFDESPVVETNMMVRPFLLILRFLPIPVRITSSFTAFLLVWHPTLGSLVWSVCKVAMLSHGRSRLPMHTDVVCNSLIAVARFKYRPTHRHHQSRPSSLQHSRGEALLCVWI
jgi:hypothetical protein